MTYLIPALILATGLVAQDRSHDACTRLVQTDAAQALDYAEAWQMEGGGAAARHCAAIATLGLGRPASAGAMLARLADEETYDPGVAARLYIQAAEALMAGGRREEAFIALKGAYEKAPDTPEVHMSAAAIYATGSEWEGVILTLDALARFANLSADAYALRGRAKFERDQYAASARDVSKALALDPYLVDAIVLRGDLLNRGHSIPDDPFAAK